MRIRSTGYRRYIYNTVKYPVPGKCIKEPGPLGLGEGHSHPGHVGGVQDHSSDLQYVSYSGLFLVTSRSAVSDFSPVQDPYAAMKMIGEGGGSARQIQETPVQIRIPV